MERPKLETLYECNQVGPGIYCRELIEYIEFVEKERTKYQNALTQIVEIGLAFIEGKLPIDIAFEHSDRLARKALLNS